MIALTYLSTASSSFDEAALRVLLTDSRRNNQAAGLTGMLLYVDGHFIQTLEGEAEDVEAAFSRIEQDPRHRDVSIALREEVDERMFPDWSMGFDSPTASDVTEVAGFTDFLTDRSDLRRSADRLGRAGIFHRIFRDRMR